MDGSEPPMPKGIAIVLGILLLPIVLTFFIGSWMFFIVTVREMWKIMGL